MNGEINWSQPIEAVHEDGTVVPVTLRSKRNGYEVRPILNDERSDAVAIFQSDGTHKWNRLTTRPHRHVPWRIRNVATPPADARTAPNGGEVGPEVVPMVERMTVAEFHAFTVSLLGSVKDAGGDILIALRDASAAGINARGRALEKEAGR